jgi:hypothetical protein
VITIGNFQYRDPKYGFSLRLPCWWRNYIVIRRRTRLTDEEYGVFFLFKYKGKVYEDVLSILVFRMTRKQWRKQGYEDSPFVLLAERNGRIIAYLTPEELPEEFLDKTKMDYDYKKYGRQIRLLKRMVNEDVPIIVKTLKFS